jgi:4-amino-4-deoxy-L-arabinose transferase-like glycosyltransferase
MAVTGPEASVDGATTSAAEPSPGATHVVATTAAPTRARRITWFHWGLLLIAGAGLAFRVGYVMETRSDATLCGSLTCGDAIYYSWQADVIGQGHGFADPRDLSMPAADHPPLTALAMAPVSAVLGSTSRLLTEQRLLMAMFGTAVIVTIGFLGRAAASSLRRNAPGRASTIGLVAAGIAAVNANLWMNDVVVMSETLATLAIVLTLLAVYRFVARPTWVMAIAIGALVGVAALARAELLLLAPITFVPIALWARTLSWPERLGRIAVAAVAALVVLAPWTLYNRARFTEPVLMSTNDGLTLVGANCDDVYGVNGDGGLGFWSLNCAYAVGDQIPPGVDQSVASRIYRQIGIDYIKDHKRQLPEVMVYRQARLWSLYGPDQMVWFNKGEGRTPWASWVGVVQWWLLLVPAAIGAVLVRRRRDHLWPLASTFVVVAITGFAFYGIIRFRIAADVAVTVLAAVALEAGIHRVRARRTARVSRTPAIDLT